MALPLSHLLETGNGRAGQAECRQESLWKQAGAKLQSREKEETGVRQKKENCQLQEAIQHHLE